MPIRLKAALIFILAGWLIATLTAGLYYSLLHRVASEITKEYFATVVGLKQKELSNFVDLAQKQLIKISHQEIGEFNPDTISSDKLDSLQASLSNQLPYLVYGELAIVDATGAAILTTNPSNLYHYAKISSDTTYKPTLVNHNYFSTKTSDSTIEFRTLITSSTQLNLIGHISVEKIQNLIKYFAQSHDKLRFYISDGTITISDSSVDAVNPNQEHTIITNCLNNKSSSAYISTTAASVWLPELNACLTVFDSLQKEAQFTQAFRNLIAISLAIIAVFIFIIVWVVIGRFGKSLQRLVVVTEAIAAGNVNPSIPLTSTKEFDSIATSLKKICQHMKRSQQELEEKIADRTHNLYFKIDQLEELLELTADSEINAEKMRKERDELLVQLQRLRDKREKS